MGVVGSEGRCPTLAIVALTTGVIEAELRQDAPVFGELTNLLGVDHHLMGLHVGHKRGRRADSVLNQLVACDKSHATRMRMCTFSTCACLK